MKLNIRKKKSFKVSEELLDIECSQKGHSGYMYVYMYIWIS